MNTIKHQHNIERRARFVRERRDQAKSNFIRKLTIAEAVYKNAVRSGGDAETAYATLLQYQNEALLQGFLSA